MEAVIEQQSAAEAAASAAAQALIATVMAHSTMCSAPHSAFVDSRYNAHKNQTDIAELKALIGAYGVLQNLIGYPELAGGVPTGRIAVIGGRRRLRSVRELVAEGGLPEDYSIDYLLVTEAEAIEISLAENHGRAPMHPADVFEGMLALSQAGRALEDIALSFHVEVAEVQRRLRLARIAPRLLDLYRDDKADFRQMQALAISDDHAAQQAAWDSFGGRDASPHELRRLLTAQQINLQTDRVARFVGAAAYQKAGGVVARDLLSGDTDGYLSDPVLLEQLAQDKLGKVRAKLLKQGSPWVDLLLRPDAAALAAYGRASMVAGALNPQQTTWRAALDERIALLDARRAGLDEADDQQACQLLEDKLDELAAQRQAIETARGTTLHPTDKALCGALVLLNEQGKVEIRHALIRPEDKPKMAMPPKALANGKLANTVHSGADRQTVRVRAVHSERLMLELTSARTVALQAVLMDRSEVALCYLTYTLMQTALSASIGWGTESLAKISVTRAALAETAGKSRAAAVLQQRKVDLLARLPAQRADWLTWLHTQPQAVVLELLAYCVAAALDATQQHDGAVRAYAALAQAVQLDMAQWWQADADNYFAHVSKERIVQVVTEAVGVQAAVPLEKMHKAAAAEAAQRAVAQAGWLPEPLRVTVSAVASPAGSAA